VSTTRAEMASYLADELIEELGRLSNFLEQFVDRYSKYGEIHEPHLPDSKREELYAAFERFTARFQRLED
jgi:hypothetical protein